MNRTIISCVLMLSAGVAAGVAAGCGAARSSKFYQLTIPGDVTPVSDPNPYPVTLVLGPMTSSHLYREDHVAYSSDGQSMGVYEYQRWAEPPTEMIADVLLRELRTSGHYRAVYKSGSDVRGDYILRGHLYDFKEVSGSTLVGRVTFELELRDTKTGTIVWTQFYTHDEPVSKKEISAVAAALDRNVQLGVTQFKTSLDNYFSTHPPSSSAAVR
jgi:ABC-type uncharacterized transport system auxiliary subunit